MKVKTGFLHFLEKLHEIPLFFSKNLLFSKYPWGHKRGLISFLTYFNIFVHLSTRKVNLHMICIPKLQLLFCMGDNGAFCQTTAPFLLAKYKIKSNKNIDLEDDTGHVLHSL